MRQHTSHHSLVTDAKQEVPSLKDLSGEPQKTISDKKEFTAKIIGWILQGGVILSASIILIGFILLPLRPGGLSVHRFLTFPQTLSQVWAGLLVLRPQAIIALGLLLLIATPIMRVVVSIVALLTLAFGLPIYFAIGASIISVIATSSGAAAAYVRDH